jgi:hypothetical protein
MRSFWISWYHTKELGGFELVAPWWYSGVRCADDADTICAAIRADHEEGAKDRILTAYDVRPDDVEWRFCNERPDDWSPFCDRFPKADWMTWPTAQAPRAAV